LDSTPAKMTLSDILKVTIIAILLESKIVLSLSLPSVMIKSATTVVVAWQGLSWHRVTVVCPTNQMGSAMVQRASKVNIYATAHLNLSSITKHLHPITPLTIFNLKEENVIFMKNFLGKNKHPPYSLMLVQYQHEVAQWDKFEGMLQSLPKSRALYRLILKSKYFLHTICHTLQKVKQITKFTIPSCTLRTLLSFL
jgi:hypothetical protein